MMVVMEELEGVESLEFDEILARRDGDRPSRPVIITTFLAILELTRLAALRIFQSLNEAAVPEGPIYLRRTFAPGDPGWKHLISEVM
jgi:chromatin segregation and condensation protein Rec8/ScpA/Scc1 (kleisin family)